MKIANFREYTGVLRELYTGEAMTETGKYYHALMASGKKLNREKAKLQSEINILNQKIKYQAQVIRTCTDKKQAGLEAAKLKKNKQILVSALKNLQNSNHFNVLSDEAKVCVCSGFLFQKFLTREILEHNPLSFPLNQAGNLVVDTGKLRHSELFTQAHHVIDFVAAYIARYPKKVKTPGYFKTLLSRSHNWAELLNFVNENFDKLDDSSKLLSDNVKASRVGVKQVKELPQQNSLLVQLLNSTALDYESSKMKHCVGKGAYDTKIASGESEIYSLRTVESDGEWLPHGTIEVKNGKIIQIKGVNNQDIAEEFVPAIRECIFELANSRDITEIYKQHKTYDLTKCGYIRAAGDTLIDLYNLPDEVHLENLAINDARIKFIAPEKIRVDCLDIAAKWNEETNQFVRRFKEIKSLNITAKCSTDDILKLREDLKTIVGDDDLSPKLSDTSNTMLGIFRRWYPQKPKEIIFYTKEGWQKENHTDMVDTISLKNDDYVCRVDTNNPSFPFMQYQHLLVDYVDINNQLSKQDIQRINAFKGMQGVQIDNADLGQLNELDLSGVKLCSLAPIVSEVEHPWSYSFHFIEFYCIKKFIKDHAVIIRNTQNLPPLMNIKLPTNIQHLMFEPSEHRKEKLPDFSQYADLQSLQLNNLDLSEDNVLSLPQGIKYLALYNCQLPKLKKWDLSKYPNLQNLGLNKCDAREIEDINLPKNIKSFSFENTIFNARYLPPKISNQISNMGPRYVVDAR